MELNNVSGCNDVSCRVHCVLEGDRIPPLESYGQALEQKCRLSSVTAEMRLPISCVNSMAVSCHVLSTQV